jgi:hypothetical protein
VVNERFTEGEGFFAGLAPVADILPGELRVDENEGRGGAGSSLEQIETWRTSLELTCDRVRTRKEDRGDCSVDSLPSGFTLRMPVWERRRPSAVC